MKTNDERTYHPYGVSNMSGEFYGYKHPAPLVLMDIYGNTIAAEQRHVYRETNRQPDQAP